MVNLLFRGNTVKKYLKKYHPYLRNLIHTLHIVSLVELLVWLILRLLLFVSIVYIGVSNTLKYTSTSFLSSLLLNLQTVQAPFLGIPPYILLESVGECSSSIFFVSIGSTYRQRSQKSTMGSLGTLKSALLIFIIFSKKE